MEHLKESHNLSLSDWGPYSKKYMGISHVADDQRGIRFDLSVFCSRYRRGTDAPSVLWESATHPWEGDPQLSYYAYRQELEWKDRLYADISFTRMADDEYVICCDCHNATDVTQNIVVHYMGFINFPGKFWEPFGEIQQYRVQLPEGGLWVDAIDYQQLQYSTMRPTDNLVLDGMRRGAIRDDGLINGIGIGCDFGRGAGDRVQYVFDVPQLIQKAQLMIRYRCPMDTISRFQASGLTENTISFHGTDDFEVLTLPLDDLVIGQHMLELVSTGDAPIELDGLAIVEFEQEVGFVPIPMHHTPTWQPSLVDNSMILKYDALQQSYGVYWDYDTYVKRDLFHSELDMFLRNNTHNHVRTQLFGDEKGHFANAFLRPISIAAGERRKIYGVVTVGTLDDVTSRIQCYDQGLDYEAIVQAGKERKLHFDYVGSGQRYQFSQEKMAATFIHNAVYPMYLKGKYIKHNSPGKWWDSLYTWDAGFTGIGLSTMDYQRGVDFLNTYVTEPGDEQTAYIQHGSMVPVQFYLYHELWNKSQDREMLRFFYPRLKQYYRFYKGDGGSSTTRTFSSNLLKTWDYFYNSGGWDDYPPQKHVHAHRMKGHVAPVITTAHCIRIAKIMSLSAHILELDEDMKEYREDIRCFSDALEVNAWDEQSGYYGYVCHNDQGDPTHILTNEDGVNYNMGLDGLYPLVSGICDPIRRERLVERLMDEDRFFTHVGLTTVDMQAPYYNRAGYWNGAVWMPHQWFYWKTLLDLGYPEHAYRIAQRALEVWKREVEETYNCYEHFIVESGRGAGWHQFTGLSSPVLSWFESYYRPGTLTTGVDAMIVQQQWNDTLTEVTADIINYNTDGTFSINVCMPESCEYEATWNGQSVEMKAYHDGFWTITLKADVTSSQLKIKQTRS